MCSNNVCIQHYYYPPLDNDWRCAYDHVSITMLHYLANLPANIAIRVCYGYSLGQIPLQKAAERQRCPFMANAATLKFD